MTIFFVPVLGPDGEVEAVAGTTRDVTEMKLAEVRIRDSEERLRFMAESMPQKIFTADPEGRIDYFNRQWMEFSGPASEDIHSWNWTLLVHPDDTADSLASWKHSLDTGQPFECVHRFRRSDGVHRWHLSRAHAMRTGDGVVTMWIGSSTDIHEQKDTEEELRRANYDLEQFAYTATHDLQEPLRGVKIYGELLASRHASKLEGEARQFIDFMRDGATRMEMLVHDLLSYTRAGRFDVPDELTDGNESLRVTLANLAGSIAEARAVVTSDALPMVNIRGTHLQQLLQNLIGNAVKYSHREREPRIHISALEKDGSWVFSVTDNGIGIDPIYKERIFGLFKRLHTNTQYSGTGIGLAICQRIVERYHGKIWVESEAGKGSAFRFALPA